MTTLSTRNEAVDNTYLKFMHLKCDISERGKSNLALSVAVESLTVRGIEDHPLVSVKGRVVLTGYVAELGLSDTREEIGG
jgi:hypothetical protein